MLRKLILVVAILSCVNMLSACGEGGGTPPVAGARVDGTGGVSPEGSGMQFGAGPDAQGPESGLPGDATAPPGKPDGLESVTQDDEPDTVCGYGTVYGVVCSKAQQIYVNDADVFVETVDCEGAPLFLETKSDLQGYYTLDKVPSGMQTIHVEKEGFTHTYNVLVKAGMLTDVTGVGHKECFKAIKPCKVGGIWGFVCNDDGTPFQDGADVAADGIGCNGEPEHIETGTDGLGNFFFSNVHEGTWKVTVAAGGFWLNYQVQVEDGKVVHVKDIGVEMCVPNKVCGEGTVTGYACKPDGAGYIGGAKVLLTTTDCDGNPFQKSTFTDGSGIYTLTGVPAGKAKVVVTKDDLEVSYEVKVPDGGVVNAKDVVDDLCFPKQCTLGSVTGYVCAPGKDYFIGGAKVWIDAFDCNGKPVHLETFSDAAGVYVLQNVPPGDVLVHVEKGGFKKEYVVTIVGGKLVKAQDLVSDLCFPPGQSECGFGKITGYVCAPNGTTKIGGAKVWVVAFDCNGKQVIVETVTDDAGNYVLDGVPAGEWKVFIEKGSFKHEYLVPVPAGGTVHAPDVVDDECFPSDEVKIAVVTGNWDSIEAVLNKLGIDYDLYDGVFLTMQAVNLLTDLGKMSEYDIIFFDCGANHSEILTFNPTLITQNLQNFVAGGGSVYASDWAFVYVEWPWPGAIDFFGGNMNNSAPKVGDSGTLIGTVVDAGLAGFVGKTKVSINFNLDAWVVVTGVPWTTTTHITGSIPQGANVPLMASHMPSGAAGGRVLYTTFHNEKQVTSDMIAILNYLVFVL